MLVKLWLVKRWFSSLSKDAGLLLIILGLLLMAGCSGEKDIFEDVPDEGITVSVKEEVAEVLIVEIKGEVIKPGVYPMKKDSRLNDLILEAGGASADANLRHTNLAIRLIDGDSFYIPRIGEEEVVPNESGGTQNKEKTIDLNKATKEDLMTVPGIGPSTADNIINYREEVGRFNSVDDLLNVDRIGDKTLEKIRSYFIVR